MRHAWDIQAVDLYANNASLSTTTTSSSTVLCLQARSLTRGRATGVLMPLMKWIKGDKAVFTMSISHESGIDRRRPEGTALPMNCSSILCRDAWNDVLLAGR